MKKVLSLLAALVVLVNFSACHSNDKLPSKNGTVFTDDAGVTISVNNPKKVAVLFSSFAEIWTLAGGEIYITVGESIERDLAPKNVLLVDDGAGKAVNTELLISYEPDFVICSADIAAQNKTAQQLNSIGIPAAQFRVESFDDYLRVLKICTDITGNEDSYRQNGLAVKEQIDNTLQNAQKSSDTKILFIRAGSSAKSTKAKTANEHFAAAMLKEFGTYNIAEKAPILLDGLSIEEIITENPEYIFITTMGNADAAIKNMKSILSSNEWQSLDAVKNNKVHFLPKDLFQFKPNARWADAYNYLAEILNDSKS